MDDKLISQLQVTSLEGAAGVMALAKILGRKGLIDIEEFKKLKEETMKELADELDKLR
ncbi:hypothetical protein [Paenibacillus sp. 79R4]|uniref:hypothetical protein n=1 Tax=Paenibacillus sp. 79R4 TaxID=2212847 RepID=UPI0015C1391E|nr:hypothetical protein [Paenibacillus sp. 79R4]